MKQLGSLPLPDSMQWTDQNSWSPVTQETSRTLGGALVMWSGPLTNGRPVTLNAEDSVTWLDGAQVSSILSMAMQPGATFTFLWGDEAFQVMFRHQDQPAVAFTPIRPHSDLFSGTIKLFQV